MTFAVDAGELEQAASKSSAVASHGVTGTLRSG